jgi:hypothetical protein
MSEPNMLDPTPELPDDTPISDVEFPARIRNVLAAAGLKTVGEVREISNDTLLSLDWGKGSVAHLRETLGLPSIDGVRTVGLEGEEQRVAKLKELAEMAAKLLETARKLPPGQDRHNALQEVGRLRVRITGLERPDLRSVHRGSRRKNDSSGTPEEDGLLRSMGAAGESTNAIATLLEHSPYAVLKRAHLLKIKLARSQPGLKVKK